MLARCGQAVRLSKKTTARMEFGVKARLTNFMGDYAAQAWS